MWALGQMLFKRKKTQLYSLFLNIFAAAMPFLHVPEELKVSRVQLHLPPSAGCSRHFPVCWVRTAEPAGLLLPAPLGAELPPAWPGAAAGKQQYRGRNLHMGVFFCQSLGLCLASAAGWASSTATEWGWDKLFLRSPLLCSSSFLTSPRARSLLSEIPLVFLTLLPIQWLSS